MPRLRDVLMAELGSLRYEPIDKRIRATAGDATVVDSTRALLVWEPKRIVPSYAVPAADIAAEIVTGGDGAAQPEHPPTLSGRPVYDPSVPFAVHTAPGEPVVVGGAAGFRPAELDGYVVLDFRGFDAWYEEDERNFAHPRDPFHRIDILHSTRHVIVEAGGETLAESARPYLLFEPPLPVRYYLPPDDVRLDRLAPSETATACAYKGHASYWALDGRDVAWYYTQPLREAAEITGRIAFFNEHVDIVVDGERLERPVTPWSRSAHL
jgi:uncharacterized protein (DUF427 family)